MCLQIPQVSSNTTEYTAIIDCPLSLGLFNFDSLAPIPLTLQASMLYRVESCTLSYSVPEASINEAVNNSNPAGFLLSTSSAPGGEQLLNNKIVFGNSQDRRLNSWRRSKSQGEKVWIDPSGIINPALSLGFAGASRLVIICTFLITTITDRDFLASWSEGCL